MYDFYFLTRNMNSEQLNEDNTIITDSFATNNQENDELGNVAAFRALANVNTSGGSIPHLSFVTNSIDPIMLKDYVSRPRLMYSGDFTTYNVSPNLYNFAFDFLSSAQIYEKLKYFRLVRGTFQIKLVVTAAPYAAGILAMSSQYDAITQYGASLAGDVPFLAANLIQKTHVMLDLGSANTCTLSIPFHLRTPYLSNSLPDNVELKRMLLYLYTLTNLYNTQIDDNVKVYYKLYISLQDAEIVIPTMDVGTYTSEMSSTQRGPISYPASIISSISHSLSSVPVIGKFALATSMVAQGIGDAAKLFGFSRPRDLGTLNYPHNVNLASGIGEVQCKSLTLDPKQEVAVDATVFGENGDNLSFKNILGRYGLVTIQSWRTTNVANDQIVSLNVSPQLVVQSVSGGVSFYAPTPLAYGSLLYSLWRGSLVYKFVIPANRFVRGKLRVFWRDSPVSTGSLDVVSNNALSVLIDVTSSTEVEVVVPWFSEHLYKSLQGLNSMTYETTNGGLCVRVEEPLICNNPDYIQSILVFVKAGDDFELAVPTSKFIQGLQYELPSTTIDGQTPMTPLSLTSFYPALPTNTLPVGYRDYAAYTSEFDNNTNNPVLSLEHSLLPNFKTGNDGAVLNIGERFNSFRTLLKRFHPWTTFYLTDIIQERFFFLPYLPFSSTVSAESATQLTVRVNTPLIHLSRMFAGMRGSVRYMIDAKISPPRITQVARGFFNPNFYVIKSSDSNPNLLALQMLFQAGIASFKTQFEPLVFDIPYQMTRWFYPTAKQASYPSTYSSGVRYGAFFSDISIPAEGRTIRDVSVAAGEDFNLVIYNGPPIICSYYYQLVD